MEKIALSSKTLESVNHYFSNVSNLTDKKGLVVLANKSEAYKPLQKDFKQGDVEIKVEASLWYSSLEEAVEGSDWHFDGYSIEEMKATKNGKSVEITNVDLAK